MKLRSIRGELLRLVLAAAIPVFVFSIAVAIWDVVAARRAVHDALEETSRALSLAVDREIASWIGALRTLATSPALESDNLQAFRRQAHQVAERYGGSITLIDANGQQVMNTRRGASAALPRARTQNYQVVFATRRPLVSDLLTGVDDHRIQLIAVYVPVLRGGQVVYSLNLGVPPATLSQLLDRQHLPKDWIGMVTDGNARIIARAGRHEEYLGRKAPDWYAKDVLSAQDTVLQGPSLEGHPISLAFEPVPGTRWAVAVAVPRAALAATWLTPLIATIAAGAVLAALAMSLSLFYARRIQHSITGLLSGNYSDPRPIREIEEVRLRLNEQAEAQARQREAEAAAASAEAANRSKDRFLTTLSHELRTPLSAIIGWIEVIRSRGQDPARTRKALDIIERNAAQQAKLIDDLLDVSRIVSGKLQVTREPTDLSAAVNEALDAARPAAQEKDLALRVAVQPGIRMHGDYARLIQITSNLLVNAVKFTPKGGRIDVALERVGPDALLTVRDTGRGIDAALLPQLFERFAQAEGARDYQPGLGLGLAIVRHLVDLHGGHVSAQSKGAGRGSTFTVRLPVLAQLREDEFGIERKAPPEGDLSGVRVLVVDDHEDGRRWLATLLSAHGARTAEAGDAAEALRVQRNFDASVVVSDIAMPGGDGYELIRGLRSMEHGARTPAIALTALAGGEDRERALREGFDTVIAKGTDPAMVVAAVARLSGGTSSG